MKILATVLMTSALLAGCSMPGAQRQNAMQGDQSQAKSTMKHSSASDMPTRAADGRLIGPTGHTLYTFGKDTNGMSNCNGQCATNWPPLAVEANAKAIGDYTIITRSDGMRQWAYKGQPLYYFVKDTKPADMSGDGVMEGNWKVVRPM